MDEVIHMSESAIKTSEKALESIIKAYCLIETIEKDDINATVKSNLMQVHSYAIAILNSINKLVFEG